jgi:hypothetical protein
LQVALHRLAFATKTAQIGLADLERVWFRRELARVRVGAPVLITALPRAGTTMLTTLLAGCPEFATPTYRDLPFVLCPMLWRALSRRFPRHDAARERAHGDGIPITLDSPEAGEEVLWGAFWPEHYTARSVVPWRDCRRDEFVGFYTEHRRKVVALRAREEPLANRYLAKNNLHVARLPALWQAVPDATVVVPFRDPLQQAFSLRQQHLRFLGIHREQPFARWYMRSLGHCEFGADLRVVDFAGWVGARDLTTAEHLSFWLEYWLHAYRHLLGIHDDRLVFVDFADLAQRRDTAPLAARLALADGAVLAQQASRLRPLPAREVDAAGVAKGLLDAARDTFTQLQRRALR